MRHPFRGPRGLIAVAACLLAAMPVQANAAAEPATEAPAVAAPAPEAPAPQAPPGLVLVQEGDNLDEMKKRGIDISRIPKKKIKGGLVFDVAAAKAKDARDAQVAKAAVNGKTARRAGATDCGYLRLPPKPCGVVHNHTGRHLELNRDTDSPTTAVRCNPIKTHRASLPSGKNSDIVFKDTDCFGSFRCSIYTGFVTFRPGEWVRVRHDVWVYPFNMPC